METIIMSDKVWECIKNGLTRLENHGKLPNYTYQKVLLANAGTTVDYVKNVPDLVSRAYRSDSGATFSDTEKAELYEAVAKDPILGCEVIKRTILGAPLSIFEEIAMASGRIDNDKLAFDMDKAHRRLNQYRNDLSNAQPTFDISCRVKNLSLNQPELVLPDNIRLRHLTTEEINQRQPYINVEYNSLLTLEQLLSYNIEMSTSVTLSIDTNSWQDYLRAHNNVRTAGSKRFSKTIKAIQFLKGQDVTYVHLLASLVYSHQSMIRFPLLPIDPNLSHFQPAQLDAGEIPNLSVLYDLVDVDSNSDRILSLAVRRYLMGQSRGSFNDRIIDFTIALEAILLPRASNNISYRFAINGANLLARIDRTSSRRDLFDRFRGAYKIRSKIVHGDDGTDQISKALIIGKFKDVRAVAEFLGNSVRKIVLYLIKAPDRDKVHKHKDCYDNWIFNYPKS